MGCICGIKHPSRRARERRSDAARRRPISPLSRAHLARLQRPPRRRGEGQVVEDPLQVAHGVLQCVVLSAEAAVAEVQLEELRLDFEGEVPAPSDLLLVPDAGRNAASNYLKP